LAVITRARKESRPQGSIVRGLRFRLSFSYLLFFTLLLVVLGVLFRQVLQNTLYEQSLNLLEEEWGEMKGYLRIENARPEWAFDTFDPEESFIVRRIQRVYILMDRNGTILQRSDNYADGTLTPPSVAQIRAVFSSNGPVITIENGGDGVTYMIRAGVIPEVRHARSTKPHKDYYISVGRPMEDAVRTQHGFTWRYFALVPFIVIVTGAVGWLLAGRALAPVTSVAQVARRITGSNLSVQIPTRGSGDELDDLIEAFNRMTERLKHSFEQMRQFSTDVSHELRTPLTGIRGQLEVALFTAETTEQYREAMMNALQDVEKLSNMVRALLMLSQAESGQLALQMTTLDLAPEVSEIVDQYQIAAEEEHVTLTCSVAEPCVVRADRTQMERMVSNLVSNAIKYTPAGGKVDVGLECEEAGARFWVQDTGIGIPPEDLPHIFDRFYRVKGRRTATKEGLGLGLSFVAWIVNAHNGKIEVDSNPGTGTRFTVTLPREDSVPEPAPVGAVEQQTA
jgi:heavy metal sensor kinase